MDLSALFNKEANLNIGHGALVDALENYQKSLELSYYPLKTTAKAASELTYSNLMGPQFMAKLFGVPGVQENIPDPQKRAELERLIEASHGNPLSNWIYNNILHKLSNPQQSQPAAATPTPPPTPAPQPQPDERAVVAERPVSGGDQQKYKMVAGDGSADAPTGIMVPVPIPPTTAAQPAATAVPPGQYGNAPAETAPAANTSWTENIANASLVKEQGKKQGEINAVNRGDLENTAYKGYFSLANLKHLGQIITSPVFQNIRQMPYGGNLELLYYGRQGTPQEQKMVGDFISGTNNIIKESSRDFQGQFRKGEQELLERMKIEPTDTIDMAKGKLENLTTMQTLFNKRAERTAELMAEPKTHYSLLQASKIAEKEINANKIREKVYDSLHPTITVARTVNGKVEKKTVPIAEAKRMGVKTKLMYLWEWGDEE